jgi:hypothetical protein
MLLLLHPGVVVAPDPRGFLGRDEQEVELRGRAVEVLALARRTKCGALLDATRCRRLPFRYWRLDFGAFLDFRSRRVFRVPMHQ